jgi:hypothetical protein
MALFAVYLVCALVGAWIAFWRAPEWPRYNLLLAIAAVPQIGHVLGIRISEMFVISVVAMTLWCLCNYRIAGVPMVAVGAAFNALAMTWHGGAMPVRADILAELGYHFDPGVLVEGSKDVVVHHSPLWLLSDWIVISIGTFILIISPGDILVAGGVVMWLLFSRFSCRDTKKSYSGSQHTPRSDPPGIAGCCRPGACGAPLARPVRCRQRAPSLPRHTRCERPGYTGCYSRPGANSRGIFG